LSKSQLQSVTDSYRTSQALETEYLYDPSASAASSVPKPKASCPIRFGQNHRQETHRSLKESHYFYLQPSPDFSDTEFWKTSYFCSILRKALLFLFHYVLL